MRNEYIYMFYLLYFRYREVINKLWIRHIFPGHRADRAQHTTPNNFKYINARGGIITQPAHIYKRPLNFPKATAVRAFVNHM